MILKIHSFFLAFPYGSMFRVSKIVNTTCNGLLSPLKTSDSTLFQIPKIIVLQIPKIHISNLKDIYFGTLRKLYYNPNKSLFKLLRNLTSNLQNTLFELQISNPKNVNSRCKKILKQCTTLQKRNPNMNPSNF
jgi:hypothetical protein